jgi:hypothetical protein
MKKITVFFVCIIIIGLSFSSCKKDEEKLDLITFENLPLGAEGYWNGSDGSGGFTCGNAFFPNTFTDWGEGITSWSGFGYSNHTNTTTPGVENQYSCYAGSGEGNSKVFGLLNIGDTLVFDIPEKVKYLYLANSTYAALSMKFGDQYAKKFGGEDGNDPDYFKVVLTLFGKNNQMVGKGSVWMADYSFEDNELDYIANAWTKIPLEDFGYLKKIAISFESTDMGEWGINTPAYVCIDNIKGVLEE